MIQITARQSHSHRFHQAGAKKPDQQFQYGVLLPSELGQRSCIDAQIVDNRQHVDQAATQSIIGSLALTKAFDLRKDLQLTALRDDYADHAAGPQAFAAVFEYTFSTAS